MTFVTKKCIIYEIILIYSFLLKQVLFVEICPNFKNLWHYITTEFLVWLLAS